MFTAFLGGYGMLGMGHSPKPVLCALSEPSVMANIMTPSFSQLKFQETLRRVRFSLFV